ELEKRGMSVFESFECSFMFFRITDKVLPVSRIKCRRPKSVSHSKIIPSDVSLKDVCTLRERLYPLCFKKRASLVTAKKLFWKSINMFFSKKRSLPILPAFIGSFTGLIIDPVVENET